MELPGNPGDMSAVWDGSTSNGMGAVRDSTGRGEGTPGGLEPVVMGGGSGCGSIPAAGTTKKNKRKRKAAAAANTGTPPEDSGSSREGGREPAEAAGNAKEDASEAEATSSSSAAVCLEPTMKEAMLELETSTKGNTA